MRWILYLFLGALNWGVAMGQLTMAPNPRLTLGISSGTQDVEIEIPFMYTPSRDVRVGKIEAIVTFPSELMTFLKPAQYLAEEEGVSFETQVGEVPAEEGQPLRSRLTVTVENPAEPFPEGTLAVLVFQMAQELEPQIVALGLEARMWAFPDMTQEIETVEAFEGRLNIQEPAMFFGCFFYLH